MRTVKLLRGYFELKDLRFVAPELREGFRLSEKCRDDEQFANVLGCDSTQAIYADIYSTGRVLLEFLAKASGRRVPLTGAYDRDSL